MRTRDACPIAELKSADMITIGLHTSLWMLPQEEWILRHLASLAYYSILAPSNVVYESEYINLWTSQLIRNEHVRSLGYPCTNVNLHINHPAICAPAIGSPPCSSRDPTRHINRRSSTWIPLRTSQYSEAPTGQWSYEWNYRITFAPRAYQRLQLRFMPVVHLTEEAA